MSPESQKSYHSGAVIFLDKTFNIPLLLDARPEIDSQTPKWTMATQLTHLHDV